MELGKLLYVSGQSVSKWEKGESSPSIENIDFLCKVFHICPNELLDYQTENVISNLEYGADKITQTSIFCFFLNVILYILGTVCVHVFEVYVFWYPYNWIIGGVLWAFAGIFTFYTTIHNFFIFKRINGSYKHIVLILTLGLTSLLMFPLISFSIYQMFSDMIILLAVGRFDFASWVHSYGFYLFILFASIVLYSILIISNKKKYLRNS